MTVYLYRDNLSIPTELCFALEREQRPSIETCYVDQHAINCLGQVIDGKVTSYEQLVGAEVYLRALLFHEEVRPIAPSMAITVINESSDPFTYTKGKSAPNYKSIDYIFGHVGHNSHICSIEQGYVFYDATIEEKYLREHTRGMFTPICNDVDDYFERIFFNDDRQLSKFLSEIPKSGIPSYLAHQAYVGKYSRLLEKAPLHRVFSHLDGEWATVEKNLSILLPVTLPPFMWIVMSMAESRDQIAPTILRLREEFRRDRINIWEQLDEIKYRLGDDNAVHKAMAGLEKALSKVMARYMGTSAESPLCVLTNVALLLFNLSNGQLPASEIIALIKEGRGLFSYYPFGSFLKYLERLDTRSFYRHFTPDEIQAIEYSMS